MAGRGRPGSDDRRPDVRAAGRAVERRAVRRRSLPGLRRQHRRVGRPGRRRGRHRPPSARLPGRWRRRCTRPTRVVCRPPRSRASAPPTACTPTSRPCATTRTTRSPGTCRSAWVTWRPVSAIRGRSPACDVGSLGPSSRALTMILEGSAGEVGVDGRTFARSLGLRSTALHRHARVRRRRAAPTSARGGGDPGPPRRGRDRRTSPRPSPAGARRPPPARQRHRDGARRAGRAGPSPASLGPRGRRRGGGGHRRPPPPGSGQAPSLTAAFVALVEMHMRRGPAARSRRPVDADRRSLARAAQRSPRRTAAAAPKGGR